jgi:hypothetical protein
MRSPCCLCKTIVVKQFQVSIATNWQALIHTMNVSYVIRSRTCEKNLYFSHWTVFVLWVFIILRHSDRFLGNDRESTMHYLLLSNGSATKHVSTGTREQR